MPSLPDLVLVFVVLVIIFGAKWFPAIGEAIGGAWYDLRHGRDNRDDTGEG